MSDPPVSEPDEQTPEQRRALFRVVRGEPDDVELAALTAVIAVAASSAVAETPEGNRAHSAWADRQAQLRQPLFPGPWAWKASVLPR